MAKSRKTTHAERVEIAKACLANDRNYQETALQYDVNYQQVYMWVRKYLERGEAGLEDMRGRRKPEPGAGRKPRRISKLEEELLDRIAELEAELQSTKQELELLKQKNQQSEE